MASTTRNLLLIVGLPAVAALSWDFVWKRPPVRFETVRAERGDIRSIVSANGTCGAVVTVQVGSQVSGIIKALYADFNSPVKKGQLIALIDPDPFVAKVDQARATQQSAQAAVDAAKAVVAKAEADVRNARAGVDTQGALARAASAGEADAQQQYRRRSEEGAGIVSPEDQETARTAYEVAQADREAAGAQEQAAEYSEASAEDQLAGAHAQVDSAVAQLHQAEAGLDQAQLDLEHTKITSPLDGIVISRDVDIGQTVASNFQAPVLFEVAQDLDRMQVDVNVDESDVSKLRVGQPAEFTVDALPGQVFDASVTQIRKAPINVQNVITYDVILAISTPVRRLFPGMTANVRILAGAHQNVLKVPNGAFRYRPAAEKPGVVPTLYSIDAGGKLVARTVTTGYRDDSYTEITSDNAHENEGFVVSERN